MINATIEKFGYPATLVAEYRHWMVLLRPAAVTLGSLVLAARSQATSYGDLPIEAFAEQAKVVHAIEAALRTFADAEKINYLMLMMVDPHVHMHVIPRHAGSRMFDGADYPDAGWPGMPDMAGAKTLNQATIARMTGALKAGWPE